MGRGWWGLVLTCAILGMPRPAAGQAGRAQVENVIQSAWPTDVDRPAAAEPVALPRLRSPVSLDGRPDEAAWADVTPLPVTMLWPTAGGEMTEVTEIRVAYDDEALWAAGRLYDSDPAAIRANTVYRDRWEGDDAFELVVDAFNDDRTALKFTVTPRGALLDDEIRNDAEPSPGVEWMNREWDGYWQARTQITEEGWTVEVRVPFSTLRFDPPSDGRVVMGLIASRYISRKSEKHIFPAISQNWQIPDYKPSQARDVVLRGVERPLALEVSPYVLGGLRTETGPIAGPRQTTTREVGVDAKYGLSSNLTLDVTVNTDFAQVESDALEVNLTRFNLFFPEKRDFFQERASVFQFTMSDEARLFHSRRIGLTPDGTPLRILGGVRLAGRVGTWDLGILNLQVEGAQGVPGENTGAARVLRTLPDGISTVGAMVTSRVPLTGSARVDGGVDAHLHLGGEDFLTVQTATSWGKGLEGGLVDQGLGRLVLERRSGTGWSGFLDLARAGPGFDPALGFMERSDYTALKGSVRHTWHPGAESPLSWHRGIVTTRAFLRNGDGSLESALQRFRWQWVLDGGTFLNAALNLEYENLVEPLQLAGQARVPPGDYYGPNLFLFGALSSGRDVSGRGIVHVGTFLDGWQVNMEAGPVWRPSRHFSARIEYRLSRLWFPGRGDRVVADVARIRLSTALDTHLSAQAFVQYERAGRGFVGDARLRYRFAEGRDLFVVYSRARTRTVDTDGGLEPAGQDRLLLKYVHTFRP